MAIHNGTTKSASYHDLPAHVAFARTGPGQEEV
jgi:hypothetical protein